MTGPEHYKEAERLLSVAENTYWEGPTAQVEFAQTCLAAATAHAIQAQTAAHVSSAYEAYPDGDQWQEALS